MREVENVSGQSMRNDTRLSFLPPFLDQLFFFFFIFLRADTVVLGMRRRITKPRIRVKELMMHKKITDDGDDVLKF